MTCSEYIIIGRVLRWQDRFGGREAEAWTRFSVYVDFFGL